MHLQNIQHIINFISLNYNRTITAKEIENISNYSFRHVQRIFKSIFKESTSRFQTRLRLEAAYKKLIYSQVNITDIATEVGYESLQSFNRLFRKQFSISPSQARVMKDKLLDNYTKEKNDSIVGEIIFISKQKVQYNSIIVKAYNTYEINAFWDLLDAQHKINTTKNYFGLVVDEPLITPDNLCRYDACISINDTEDVSTSKDIFGGKYLKYTHIGSYSLIESTYNNAYYDALYNICKPIATTPIIEHYRIHNQHTNYETKFETDILIPILS